MLPVATLQDRLDRAIRNSVFLSEGSRSFATAGSDIKDLRGGQLRGGYGLTFKEGTVSTAILDIVSLTTPGEVRTVIAGRVVARSVSSNRAGKRRWSVPYFARDTMAKNTLAVHIDTHIASARESEWPDQAFVTHCVDGVPEVGVVRLGHAGPLSRVQSGSGTLARRPVHLIYQGE